MSGRSHISALFALRLSMVTVLLAAATTVTGQAFADSLFFASDNFSATCGAAVPNMAWTFENPTGDSSFVSLTNGELLISVDSAQEHAAFVTTNSAPAVLQDVADVDFVIEAKFASPLIATAGVEQPLGLLIEQSPSRFLRVDFSSYNGLTFLYAAGITVGAGSPEALPLQQLPGLVPPMYVRVTRAGNTFTFEYSLDNSAWILLGDLNPSPSIQVNRIGVYGANMAGVSHTVQLDYLVDVTPGSGECNSNGTLDGQEIANDTAFDCDGDGVLDSCTPFPDCNSNTIPDDQDIAIGTSVDCNKNGVPDECDMLGNVIYVDMSAAGSNDGTTWENAFIELQTALFAAECLGGVVTEIRVAQGTYRPDFDVSSNGHTGDREATFHLVDGVGLYGGYAGFGAPDPDHRDIDSNATILSGDLAGDDAGTIGIEENAYHVVTSTNVGTTAVLDGFTTTRGNANGKFHPHYYGGGLYNWFSRIQILNCRIIDNYATRAGGGIFNIHQSPNIDNCEFSRNQARQGGGIYNEKTPDPMLANCLFSNNTGSYGGGAVYYWDCGRPQIFNCIFSGNSGHWAGAIYNHQSNPNLINCTLSDNYGDECGGVYNIFGRPSIVNCILWGNTPSQLLNDSLCTLPTVIFSNIEGGWTGTGNIAANPLFTIGPEGQFYLSQISAGQTLDSPCVNAGKGTASPYIS